MLNLSTNVHLRFLSLKPTRITKFNSYLPAQFKMFLFLVNRSKYIKHACKLLNFLFSS